MKIVRINQHNLADINIANQPFEINLKVYPDDTWDYADYINNPDKTILLAYIDGECVGQIVLKRDWNRYAFIEDICVAKSARGQGIGTELIQKAIEWAKKSDLQGLALETQDNNLLACRFYAKCGFVIGAVNTMLYRNFDKDEFAVFWYLPF